MNHIRFMYHVKFNIPLVSGIECGYPASIKHGGYTLINNTVSYLSQVLYSCEEGYEMTGKDLSRRPTLVLGSLINWYRLRLIFRYVC